MSYLQASVANSKVMLMSSIISFPQQTNIKAIILARVSTREQQDGYSIDAQLHRLKTYCEHKKLNVVKTFQIIESSTNGDRKEFMKMIAYVRQSKTPIALIADKVDRVQRSFREYPLLDTLIQEGKLELHFNTENYIISRDSTSQGKLMWHFGIVMAQSYIDSLRDNGKRSYDQKTRLGEWSHMAPIGYINVRASTKRGTLAIDEDRAPLIRKLFETYSTGEFTLSQLQQKARKWGLKNGRGLQDYLPRSQIHAILRNPFYYGMMRVKGQLHPHVHLPIITKELFDQCQAIMDGRNGKQFKWAGKEFIFRGLLTCATSGLTVTADQKTRHYKDGHTNTWTYLRCRQPDHPEKAMYVREEEILKQAEAALDRLHIPQEIMQDITGYLKLTAKSERSFVHRQIGELQREHTILQKRLDVLFDKMLDGTVDQQDFVDKRAKLRQSQIDIEEKISASRAGDDGFQDAMLTVLNVCSRARQIFQGSTIAEKRSILNFILSNLQLKGTTLCYEYKKPFNELVNNTSCLEWRSRQDSNLQPLA